jgi:hypothetical protein
VKPVGKMSHGGHRRRWEDNKMELREVGCKGVDWIELAQDRDQWREPSGSIQRDVVTS